MGEKIATMSNYNFRPSIKIFDFDFNKIKKMFFKKTRRHVDAGPVCRCDRQSLLPPLFDQVEGPERSGLPVNI